MARTPLFGALRSALRDIGRDERQTSPDTRRGWTRRRFLGTSALGLASAACGAGSSGVRPSPHAPRVAIVGAGAAGLAAARRLEQAGVAPAIYEASSRTGGRVMTARDLHAPGQWIELGAEFIDTGHTVVHALARELGLTVVDFADPGDGLAPETYFFDGQHHGRDDLVAGLRALAPRIEEDLARIRGEPTHRDDAGASELDRMPLDRYFRDIGASGWLATLLDVAYVSEFGLETADQSALNFLLLYSTETGVLYGESDERYKIRGGNQQLVDGLRDRVRAPIEMDTELVAVRPRGDGATLVLRRRGSATSHEVAADAVILAMPFTTLRRVDVQIPLPDVKRRVIDELGHGTNAKLVVGCASRPWRAAAVISDAPFQMAWDASRLQPGEGGTITLYPGGAAGVAVGEGTPEARADEMLPGLERAVPGVAAAARARGAVHRFHWPSHPHTLCSYACYRPGQWTTLHGAEADAVPPLYFAGEQTESEHQGYIEGALRSGVRAAEEVLSVG